MICVKKLTLWVNLDNSIWTCQHDEVINLDLVILIGSVIDKMTIYLIGK
jgi:hypothetical protein